MQVPDGSPWLPMAGEAVTDQHTEESSKKREEEKMEEEGREMREGSKNRLPCPAARLPLNLLHTQQKPVTESTGHREQIGVLVNYSFTYDGVMFVLPIFSTFQKMDPCYD